MLRQCSAEREYPPDPEACLRAVLATLATSLQTEQLGLMALESLLVMEHRKCCSREAAF